MNFRRNIKNPIEQRNTTARILRKLRRQFHKLNLLGYCDGINWRTCWCHEINQDCPYQIAGVNCGSGSDSAKGFALRAYTIADAMLAEREKQPQEG